MNIFIYIFAGILILAILYTLFRIVRLLDVIKGRKDENISSATHVLQPILLMIFVVGGLIWMFSYGVEAADRYILPLASEHGKIIDELFWLTTILTLVVLVGTHLVLVFFAIVYRYNPKKRASYFHENHKLELVWTVIPAIVLAVLLFQGWKNWVKITSPAPEDAEAIEIVGYQFAWASRYSGKDGKLGTSDYRLIDAENRIGIDFADPRALDDFIPREIHIPKSRPIKFTIRALDVIHSFYAPHFRVQMYAVPGMETTFWVTPSKTTAEMREELDDPNFNYEIACNKICGKGHFAMRYTIIVDEPETYETWRSEQEPWLSKHPDYAAKLFPSTFPGFGQK